MIILILLILMLIININIDIIISYCTVISGSCHVITDVVFIYLSVN